MSQWHRNERQVAERERILRKRAEHDIETARAGVEVLDMRRHHRLGPLEPHEDCVDAFHEGRMPCSRCAWLLGANTEGAAYVDAWVDRDD